MLKHEDNAVARINGNNLQPLSGISVTVTDKVTGLPASLYKDDEITPIAQPLTTDNNGYYGFKAPDGAYILTFSGQRIATFTREIVLDDPKDNPYATKAELAAGTGSALVTFTQAGTLTIPRTTQDKLREFYVSPEDYDNTTQSGGDWSAALQKAASSGKGILLTAGKIYGVSREIQLTTSGIIITGGGTIKILPSYDVSGGTLSVLNVSGENTTIDAVTFDGTGAPYGTLNNRFIWCTAPRLRVTSRASFINLPKGGSNFNGAIGCNSLAPYANVDGAYFKNNPGAVFYQGRNSHVVRCTIIDPNDVAIAFNGTNCIGCVAIGNVIDNELNNSCSALIAAEEGASEWVISDNRLKGVKDGIGIAALNVAVTSQARGGKIANNIINGGGGTTTAPCALISCTAYYDYVDISNNTIFNLPSGNSNSRMLIAAATGGQVTSNIIDGESVSGLSAMVNINAGARGLTYKDNVSRCSSGGRHVLFLGGNYAGNPVSIEGGKFYGGAEGINTDLNSGSISNLSLYIKNIADNTATNITVCSSLLGSRSAWMNAGAWAKPHSIGVFTNMYCTGYPSSGTFLNGDLLHWLSPAYPGYSSMMRVSGTWRDTGAFA